MGRPAGRVDSPTVLYQPVHHYQTEYVIDGAKGNGYVLLPSVLARPFNSLSRIQLSMQKRSCEECKKLYFAKNAWTQPSLTATALKF